MLKLINNFIADPNSILFKHRRFLKQLEEQKMKEKDEKDREEEQKEKKVKQFKDVAAKQRTKITLLKKDEQIK
jgi:hypothetical protein